MVGGKRGQRSGHPRLLSCGNEKSVTREAEFANREVGRCGLAGGSFRESQGAAGLEDPLLLRI